MTIKDQVLDLLETNKGIYFSGEQIARDLSVSRAAVWKAINSLRADGYSIDAVTNKGYRLSLSTDILSPQGITKYLEKDAHVLHIDVADQVESTNTLVREKANQGIPEGYTLLANCQTAGRGRSGRSFYSPAGTGVYLSVLLRPRDCNAQAAVRITTMAAVAMCEAIEEVSGQKPAVKWVNDIFLHGKKICGILTEGSFSLETGMLEYAVLGLGINVYAPAEGFPQELQNVAGVLLDSPRDDAKNHLAAAFLNRFFCYYYSDSHRQVVAKYREYSMVIGKEILVLQNGIQKKAIARGIDSECRLLVAYEDGTAEKLSYGEISIRLSQKKHCSV